MAESSPEPVDHREGVAEFAALNRRRLFGSPPLNVEELERWAQLRDSLEARFGVEEGPQEGSDRRIQFRIPTHLEVRFESGAALQSAYLSNISTGGLFIATDAPLEPGTPIALSLSAGDDRLQLQGTVAWIGRARENEGPEGMGVRFEQLTPDQRRMIRAILDRELD